MFIDKLFKLILVLLLFYLFSGCQNTKVKEPKMQRLTINLQEGDPPSLNPYVGVDLRSRCLFLSLFEPLMRRNAQGEIELAAAQSVEIDPTKTVYTFHIRPHNWSNGLPVTSYHFADAWKYALRPNSYCLRADLFYSIKNAELAKRGELSTDAVGITTPDAHTLIVQLEHPTPYFLDLAATSFFSPLYDPSEKEPECFNGPFIVQERIHDQKLILKKNPHYWDHASILLQEICFTMVRDPATSLAMYEKKELDLVGDPFSSLPFDAIPALEQSGQLKTKLISRMFYLLLNTEVPPLHSSSLRQALAFSIDRHLLTQHLFFGEIPSLSALPKPLSLVEGSKLQENQKDPVALFEKALQELHLTRETFPTLVFSYAELSGQKKLAEFIQEQWKKVLGIEIKLVCSEWNVHIVNLRKGQYQMGTLHLTTLYQDPMFYFDLFRKKTRRL